MIALPLALALAYGAAAWRQRARARPWSLARAAFFAVGCLLLFWAWTPPVAAWAHADAGGHMAQHLLAGMFAPLALVLGAPVTLLLRTLPVGRARRVSRLLRSRLLRALTHPAAALLLSTGSLYALYLTPLFAATAGSVSFHAALNLHVLASGYLYCWVVLGGPDPAGHPWSFGVRAGLWVAGTAAHGILAKLMYAHYLPAGAGFSERDLEAAAELMYAGGDLAELLLLVALCARWYRSRRRRPAAPPRRYRRIRLPSTKPSRPVSATLRMTCKPV